MAPSKEDKPYTVKPHTQVDLEHRQSEDYKAPGDVTSRNTLNPNPFGEGDYIGTDPIYQNYAEDTHKPLASKKGVEKEAEAAFKAEYEVDEADAVPDPGMGGVTTVSQVGSPDVPDTLIGGDGVTHPRADANSESESDDEDEDGPVTEEETSSGQQGPTPTPTQPPAPGN